MYESLNKYSVVDVARTLINEINEYNPTNAQVIDIFVKYIVIPFFIFLVLGLFLLYIFLFSFVDLYAVFNKCGKRVKATSLNADVGPL